MLARLHRPHQYTALSPESAPEENVVVQRYSCFDLGNLKIDRTKAKRKRRSEQKRTNRGVYTEITAEARISGFPRLSRKPTCMHACRILL